MIGRMDRGFCRVGLAAMLPLLHEQDFAETDGTVPPNCNEDLTSPLANLPLLTMPMLHWAITGFSYLGGMLREWPLQERAQRFVESMYGKNQAQHETESAWY